MSKAASRTVILAPIVLIALALVAIIPPLTKAGQVASQAASGINIQYAPAARQERVKEGGPGFVRITTLDEGTKCTVLVNMHHGAPGSIDPNEGQPTFTLPVGCGKVTYDQAWEGFKKALMDVFRQGKFTPEEFLKFNDIFFQLLREVFPV